MFLKVAQEDSFVIDTEVFSKSEPQPMGYVKENSHFNGINKTLR